MKYPIIAIRGWSLHSTDVFGENVRLSSLAVKKVGDWDSLVTYSDKVPTMTSPFGLWCVKPHYAWWLRKTYRPQVMGVVELPGINVETEHGYLGQKCIILSLFINHERVNSREMFRHSNVKKQLEDFYACPVYTRLPNGSQWLKLVREERKRNARLSYLLSDH